MLGPVRNLDRRVYRAVALYIYIYCEHAGAALPYPTSCTAQDASAEKEMEKNNCVILKKNFVTMHIKY